MTSTIERLATGEELRAIADHEQRLTAAGEVAERAAAISRAERLRRDAAAVLLFRTGLPAVRVWKDTLDVSRTLWGRILRLADPAARRQELTGLLRAKASHREVVLAEREVEKAEELAAAIARVREEVAELRGQQRVERLREIAETSARLVRTHDQLAAEAAEVRNRTAYGLISREYGYAPSNADVARMARVTTARIAQLRKSY